MDNRSLIENLDRILVSTDFSENATEAVRCAAGLARSSGAELFVVHVIRPTIYPMYRVIKHKSFPNMEEEVLRYCRTSLEDLIGKLCEGVRAEACLVEGPTAARAIVDCARDKNVDLIVIATHGHTGLKHALLGSVAEKVIRTARCPVLTFRAKDLESSDESHD